MEEIYERALTQTISLTMPYITKLDELARELNSNKSETVRQAIDLLWDKVQAQKSNPISDVSVEAQS
jgi:predicted transcriptional regulator